MALPLAGSARRIVPLIVALVMGLLGVLLAKTYIGQERQKMQREWQRLTADYRSPVEVVVAAEDLAEGTTIEEAVLKTAAVPEKFVQPYVARSPRELLGMVTIAPIAEGEQILLNKVRRAEDVAANMTLSTLMPKGKRAITIGVDAITGVGGFVRPGDKVDVLWTFKLPAVGKQEGQVVTLTMFQEVTVLAVGRDLSRGRQQSEPAKEYTVTLALNPEETSFLLFAREQGRIQLSLRSDQETGHASVPPANINTLLEKQLGIKPVEAQVKTPREVEVYKGLKRDVVVLSEQK